MRFPIITPQSRKRLLTFAVLLILAQPLFTVAHYSWNELIRPYPWYADSLAIPVFGEVVLWFLLMPLAIFFIVVTSRNYQAHVPLFQRRTLSRRYLTVNILFGLFIIYAAFSLVDVVLYANLFMLLDVVLSLYLILAVRATVIAGRMDQ